MMKKVKKVTDTIFLVLIILLTFSSCNKPDIKSVVIPEALYQVLEDGDIICRLGNGVFSQYISDVSVSDKRFSHMGIIRINDGLITVINAEGDTGHGRDFVCEITIEEFLKDAVSAGVYRVNNINRSLISGLAMEYIGIPFDWQFDLIDESKIYCTELLQIILKRITPGLVLDTVYFNIAGKDIIPLEAISASPLFSEVYFTELK